MPNRAIKLEEKAIELSGRLLNLCYKDAHIKKDGFEEARIKLQNGEALKKFRQIVQAQGGRYDISSEGLLDPMQAKPLLSKKSGIITKIIGVVIDVAFTDGYVPGIYEALEVQDAPHKLVLEVQQQLGDGVVRTIAMNPVDGVKRGLSVLSTGGPISVPVGE